MKFEPRWQKLKPLFSGKKIEAIFVSFLPNVRYLSGFSGSYAYLLFTPERKYFFTDFRYAEEVRELEKLYEIVVIKSSFFKEFTKFLKKKNIKALGVEANSLSLSFYQKLKEEADCLLVSLDLSLLRAVKDRGEILAVKKAVKIAVEAFHKLLLIVKPGLRERDLAVELEYLLRKEGSEELPFAPIVASGPNSSRPHARAGLRKVKKGDLIKIDWGARFNGYCSDLTRVVHLGAVDEEKERVFRLVSEARQIALSFLSSSLKASEVDREVRLFFKKKGVLPLFGHGLGHGIGLEAHEAPLLNRESQDFLRKGMVFTVEPGLYYPGRFGIRLEDDVYLHSRKIEVLSEALCPDWFVL